MLFYIDTSIQTQHSPSPRPAANTFKASASGLRRKTPPVGAALGRCGAQELDPRVDRGFQTLGSWSTAWRDDGAAGVKRWAQRGEGERTPAVRWWVFPEPKAQCASGPARLRAPPFPAPLWARSPELEAHQPSGCSRGAEAPGETRARVWAPGGDTFSPGAHRAPHPCTHRVLGAAF